MKKRLLAFLLAASFAFSMLVMPVSAADTGISNYAVQTAITLGAFDSEQTGALDAVVTRGAFAKMLTAFSSYRESAGSQGTAGTLFKDVPSDSAAAPYIRIAVQQGWMNGYTDGTFRPDNSVTLEEACTAVLKLLGYKMTELSGSFPNAQLNKSSELGLRDQLSCTQGQALTYQDCAVLLYNALTANNSSGTSYGSTLGFTVSNKQVDISSVLTTSLKGPFIASEGETLPFTPTTYYRNDKVTTSGEIDAYDIYYYSESLKTVWIYTHRAAGRITAVSPSASAPTSVTVAGTAYQIASSAVASQISSLNGGGVGQVVTLLLGMNDTVAGIITGDAADEVYYGIVQSASRSLVDENGADVLQTVKVMCTDGISRTVNVDKSINFPVATLVKVTVSSTGENVQYIDSKSVSGLFDAETNTFGDYKIADDIEIMDTTAGGAAGTVRPSRLSGINLSGSNVRYYTLNSKGEIDSLILNDVTGDLWNYGVLDDVKNIAANWSSITSLAKALVASTSSSSSSSSSGSSSSSSSSSSGSTSTSSTTKTQPISELSSVLVPTTSEILWGVINGDLVSTLWSKLTTSTGSLASIGLRQLATYTGEPLSTLLNFAGSGASYVCYVNGQMAYFTTSIKYPVIAGAIGVSTETSGSVRAMAQLMPMKIEKVGAATVISDNGTRYEMADNTQVYLWYKGQYYSTKLTSVNTSEYYLTGWYDNFGCAAGKKVRVIIAVKND